MAPKASREKKLKAPDETSKASKSSHITYLQMITEAVAAMKGRTGSSQPAIAKVVGEKYKPATFKQKPAAKKVLSAATTRKTVKKCVKAPEPDVVKAKAETSVKSSDVKAAKPKAVANPGNPKPAEHSKPQPVKPASGKKAVAAATKKSAPKKASSTPKKSNKSVKRASAEPKASAAKKTKVSAAT